MAAREVISLADGEERFAGTEVFLTWNAPIEERVTQVETMLARINKLTPVGRGTSLLEIGVGAGWFAVLCAERGLQCTGVEHNPSYRDHAVALAASRGVSLDVLLGSVEDVPLPAASFDIAVAASVFEHVRDHERALRNVHDALRPGGVLYFSSTNKFSPRSGEYPRPFCGWLPFWARKTAASRPSGRADPGDRRNRLSPIYVCRSTPAIPPNRLFSFSFTV